MSLLDLANETLLEITKDFGPKDLNSLIQLSPRLARLLTHQLNLFALKPKYRVTALYWAALNGREDVVRLVLEKGKNFMIKEYPKLHGDPGTIIYYASSKKFSEELVSLVMKKGSTGALIVQDNFDESTPLHWAVRHGHDTMFKLLLEKTHDLETKDRRGWTALHQAVSEENEMAVELLLERWAEVNTQDKRNSTPLHHAAINGSERIARMLLEWKDLDLYIEDIEGDYAFETAIKNGHRDVAQLLLERTDPSLQGHRKPKVPRQYEGPLNFARLLFEASGITFRNILKETPLLLAIHHGYKDCAKSFLKIEENLIAVDRTGNTPLHIAARYSDTEIVDLLLDKGCDINSRNKEGWTPLHLAIFYNLKHKGVVERLLERGADVTLKTGTGDTAFDLAKNNLNRDEISRLLGNTPVREEVEEPSENEDSDPEQPAFSIPAWQRERLTPYWRTVDVDRRPSPAWQLSDRLPVPRWIMDNHAPRHPRNIPQRVEYNSDEWRERESEAKKWSEEYVKLLVRYGAETETDELEDE